MYLLGRADQSVGTRDCSVSQCDQEDSGSLGHSSLKPEPVASLVSVSKVGSGVGKLGPQSSQSGVFHTWKCAEQVEHKEG